MTEEQQASERKRRSRPKADPPDWTPFRQRVYRILEKHGPQRARMLLSRLDIKARKPDTPFLALMSSLNALERRGRAEKYKKKNHIFWRIPAYEDRIG